MQQIINRFLREIAEQDRSVLPDACRHRLDGAIAILLTCEQDMELARMRRQVGDSGKAPLPDM